LKQKTELIDQLESKAAEMGESVHKLESQYVLPSKQFDEEDSQRFESKKISPSKESGVDGITSSSSGDVTAAQGLVLVDQSDTEPPIPRAESCYDMSLHDEVRENKSDTGIEKSYNVQEEIAKES